MTCKNIWERSVMFDGNQIIETKWTCHNRQWYIERGYKYTTINQPLFVKAKDLTHGSKEKVVVKCDCCGKEFKVQYGCYLKAVNKDMCGPCSHKRTGQKKIRTNAHKTIEQARAICNFYGYKLITTEQEYNGTKGDITFECLKHGQQTMKLDNLLRGHRCRKCARDYITNLQRLPIDQVIERIESVNGNKLLNPNDYVDMFENNLIVQCKCGNTFTVSLHNYRFTNVCKLCSNKESRGERIIREYLENNQIEFIQEKRFDDCKDKNVLPFDFYLPKYNTCIEFDGEQHYWDVFSKESTEHTQKHDLMKNAYCDNNNIRLLRIPYYKKKQISDILDTELQVKDIV